MKNLMFCDFLERIRGIVVNKKYTVMSGWVCSMTDGEIHFISNEQLVRLYGVKKRDCHFAPPHGMRMGWIPSAGTIMLTPRVDGNYKVIK